MNTRQLLSLWATGIALVALCLYPPWVVGWAIVSGEDDVSNKKVVCFAPVWTGPSELLGRASRDEIKAGRAKWKQSKQEYEIAHAQWLERKQQWERENVEPDEDNASDPAPEVRESWGASLRERAAERMRKQFPEPPPPDPGSAPFATIVSLASPDSVFARLSFSRLILECVVVLTIGGLVFISLRTSKGPIVGA